MFSFTLMWFAVLYIYYVYIYFGLLSMALPELNKGLTKE